MWEIYDYVDEKGNNLIQVWARGIPKQQKKKLQSRLDILAKAGDLPPGVLIKTEVEYIQKIKIQGNPKLRPMICAGPVPGEKAFTLLVGVKEVSWKFVPNGAEIDAAIRRRSVIDNPKVRRVKHVRLN